MDRAGFDQILETVIASLPSEVRALLDEIAIVVEDEPSDEILADLGIEPGEREEADLCGVHSGVPLTERGVFGSQMIPDTICIFRGPIGRLAGQSRRGLEKQIRITLLHEIGHHFGFDEEKLRELGYE